jgi:hypothetical protein
MLMRRTFLILLAGMVASAPAAGQTRVCMSGDITLGSNLDRAAARASALKLRAEWGMSDHPDSLLAPLRPLVADADLLLLNVEGAIGAGPAPRKCGPRSTACFAFRMPVSAARAMRELSANDAPVVGNVANNHARDAGNEGLQATRRHLEHAGVHVTGLDTIATPVVTARGDTIALLGFYTSHETPDARDLDAVRRHVARAAERWRTVIVSTHMGAEGVSAQRTPDRREIFLGKIDRGNAVAFARTAFDAGATLVWGHGPHVMRAAEWRDGRLALYSLGNTVTYGPFSNGEPKNRGAIACVTIDSAGGISAAELRSTVQLAPGVVMPDSTGRAAFLVDSLGRLDFPATGARVEADGQMLRSGEIKPQGRRSTPRRPRRVG